MIGGIYGFLFLMIVAIMFYDPDDGWIAAALTGRHSLTNDGATHGVASPVRRKFLLLCSRPTLDGSSRLSRGRS